MKKCKWNHLGYCTAKEQINFNCSFAKGKILKECKAKEKDLIEACQMCENNPMDAEFLYDEYCKECEKKLSKRGRR